MDDARLKGLLADLDGVLGVEFAGFDKSDLEVLSNAPGADDAVDMDVADKLNEKWRVELGDMWQLGRHRILCGDSTSKEDVRRLVGDLKPEIMVTDPPYGVNYDPSWRKEAGINKSNLKQGSVKSDDKADWTEAWRLFQGDVAYVYHAGVHASTVQASLEMAGLCIRAQIIWAKDRMSLSRGDYHWQHEPCWYAVREGRQGLRNDDRTQTTLWEIPARDDDGHWHGTQKPIECMARPMRNHECNVVYEPCILS